MSLDINKIIMESIDETLKASNIEKEAVVEAKEEVVDPTESDICETAIDRVSMAIPAAISAGLGALTLRKRIRNAENLNEGSLGWKRMNRKGLRTVGKDSIISNAVKSTNPSSPLMSMLSSLGSKGMTRQNQRLESSQLR